MNVSLNAEQNQQPPASNDPLSRGPTWKRILPTVIGVLAALIASIPIVVVGVQILISINLYGDRDSAFVSLLLIGATVLVVVFIGLIAKKLSRWFIHKLDQGAR